MKKFLNITKFIVLYLDPDMYKPFYKTRGPISFDYISENNVADVAENFPEGKIAVFKEKLQDGCRGMFARHNDAVVGYMWRKDYSTAKNIKADGYVPLKGDFSHLHFARVVPAMRGRALQLILFSKLIDEALKAGVSDYYTDMEQGNTIAVRGAVKLGFRGAFRLFVLKFPTGHSLSFRLRSKPGDIHLPRSGKK